MKKLAIDVETYSSADLRKSGVFSYTENDDFEILLFAYAFEDDEVEIIDLAQNEKLPAKILKALLDPSITKTAFNAQFERTCLEKYLNQAMLTKQLSCSMAHSLSLGLPGSLKAVAETLRLTDKKMDEGTALIRYFSIPCKATKKNAIRTRNLPKHYQEKRDFLKIIINKT